MYHQSLTLDQHSDSLEARLAALLHCLVGGFNKDNNQCFKEVCGSIKTDQNG